MPTEEPARTTEAFRRALPELVRLNRYERRAIARRDQAICALMQSEGLSRLCKTQNEPNLC